MWCFLGSHQASFLGLHSCVTLIAGLCQIVQDVSLLFTHPLSWSSQLLSDETSPLHYNGDLGFSAETVFSSSSNHTFGMRNGTACILPPLFLTDTGSSACWTATLHPPYISSLLSCIIQDSLPHLSKPPSPWCPLHAFTGSCHGLSERGREVTLRSGPSLFMVGMLLLCQWKCMFWHALCDQENRVLWQQVISRGETYAHFWLILLAQKMNTRVIITYKPW